MAWTLTKTALKGGIYHGLLSHEGRAKIPPPALTATLQGHVLDVPQIHPVDGTLNQHQVTVVLPMDVVSDGLNIVTLSIAGETEVLATIPVLAGDMVPDDLREDVAFLREELYLLRSAFQRVMAERD